MIKKEPTETLSIRILKKTKQKLQRIYKLGTLNKQFYEYAEKLLRENEQKKANKQ